MGWDRLDQQNQTDPEGDGNPGQSDIEMAMSYDMVRGVTVLFGGTGSGDSKTWEWNGTSWAKRMDQSTLDPRAPETRGRATMVFDTTRGVTVMFGGESELTGDDLFDTWTWDGTTWLEVNTAPEGLNSREKAMGAFDLGQEALVVFGGRDEMTDILYGDTWLWANGNWRDFSDLENAPSARRGSAMVYDFVGQRTHLVAKTTHRRVGRYLGLRKRKLGTTRCRYVTAGAHRGGHGRRRRWRSDFIWW